MVGVLAICVQVLDNINWRTLLASRETRDGGVRTGTALVATALLVVVDHEPLYVVRIGGGASATHNTVVRLH